MPASDTPVRNRRTRRDDMLRAKREMKRFINAPVREHAQKRILGETRSASVRKAKQSVPRMKPNWTVEVKEPSESPFRFHSRWISGRTAFVANQSEVPANCEKIM